MSAQEEALQAIQSAEYLLHRELEQQSDPVLVMIPREQKLTFAGLLGQMREMLESGHLPKRDAFTPQIKDAVLDDWPHTQLSSALVNAEKKFLAALPE